MSEAAEEGKPAGNGEVVPETAAGAAGDPVADDVSGVEAEGAGADVGAEEIEPDTHEADAAVLAESRRHTRRSFLLAGTAAAVGAGFYKWLDVEPSLEGQPGVLRRTFQTNAAISRELTGNYVLAPTYPLARAENLRVNGTNGLKKELVPASWRLQLVGVRGARKDPRFVEDVTAWEYQYSKAHSSEDEGHDTKFDPSKQKAAAGAMPEKAEEDENQTGRKPRGLEEAGESDSTLDPNTPGLLLEIGDLKRFPRHELVTQSSASRDGARSCIGVVSGLRTFSRRIPLSWLAGRSQNTSTWRHRTAITTPATIWMCADILSRCW